MVVDTALDEDDQCSALQVKTAKTVKLAANTTSDEDDPCTGGLAGQILGKVPDCIHACPKTCGAIREVIDTYLSVWHFRSASRTKQTICKNKASISCFGIGVGIPKCRPLIDAAAQYAGLKLPTTLGELDKKCADAALLALPM